MWVAIFDRRENPCNDLPDSRSVLRMQACCVIMMITRFTNYLDIRPETKASKTNIRGKHPPGHC